MSATNTGWRLILLESPSPSLTVESNPITLELVSPGPQGPSGSAAAVTSVNGQTGAVVLNAASVGAAASVHTHAIADVAGLQTALDEALETMTKTVRKASAGTITKGQVVYIVGSTGSHLTVELADADTEATAATTIGVALTTITGTTDGEIIIQGYLDGLSNLPISGFTDGAALWLSQTAGGWTNTRPTQPAHGVFLGWVVSASNGSSGRAYIKVINGQELDELHDVLISGKAEKDLFSYDATAGLWKNRTLAAAGVAAASHGHAISDVTGLQTALDGKAATAHTHVTGDISGLGTMATLGSTAGSDLSGTWPTITVQKVQGNTFDSGTPADGDVWMYQTVANRWTHTSFVDVLAYNDIGWNGTTFTVDAIATGSITFPTFGESITNPVNGRIDFTPDPSGISAWKLYVDMTSFNVGVRLGVIRTSNNAMNPDGSYIVFDTTAQIATDKSLSFHSADWMQLRGTSTGNDTAQLCVRSNFAGSSGAFALIDLTQLGTATRSPATAHVDPTFYVYSNDIAEANDFVRMSHNRTDGVIESGNGKLRLKGASVVRIEGSGGAFDLDSTPGNNGDVLTLNGGVVSLQPPTGGGGGVSKAFAVAMAVAL